MEDGGILIYDLSFNTDNWIEGIVSVDTVVEEELKIARICQSRLEKGIFNANFVFLVKDNGKFDFDIDEHSLGVFEIDKVNKIMEKVGFKTYIYGDFTFETWKRGECERPIYVGVKNLKERENNMRIAVSVTDDEKFTEHFGRAQKFLIYEFDGEKLNLLIGENLLRFPVKNINGENL